MICLKKNRGPSLYGAEQGSDQSHWMDNGVDGKCLCLWFFFLFWPCFLLPVVHVLSSPWPAGVGKVEGVVVVRRDNEITNSQR